MNNIIIHLSAVYFLLAVLMVLRPWLSRKNVLFGVVFGDAEIWKNKEARKIINRFVFYSSGIVFVLAAVFVLIVYNANMTDMALIKFYSIGVLWFILLEIPPYILANRSTKKLKTVLPDRNLVKDKISVEIGGQKNTKPLSMLWYSLAIIPVIITIVIGISYYPEMPANLVTHYGINGVTNGIKAKSVGLILSPVFNQILFSLLMILIGFLIRRAPASVKGSPGAAPGYPFFRKIISMFIVAMTLVVEFQYMFIEFAYAGLVSNIKLWEDILFVLSLILVAALIFAYFLFARRKVPSGEVFDDDNKWIFGFIYFNPSDSSLFVEKRHGIGYTINFGKPTSVFFIVGIILIIILMGHFKH